jgi:hypothetical protein
MRGRDYRTENRREGEAGGKGEHSYCRFQMEDFRIWIFWKGDFKGGVLGSFSAAQ